MPYHPGRRFHPGPYHSILEDFEKNPMENNSEERNNNFIEKYQPIFDNFFYYFVKKIKWEGDTPTHFPILIFQILINYLINDLKLKISRNTATILLDLFINSWMKYGERFLRRAIEERRRAQVRLNQELHRQQRRQPRFLRQYQHGQRQSRSHSPSMDADLHQRYSFAFV